MNKLAIFILGLGILAPLPALGEGVQSTASTTSTSTTRTSTTITSTITDPIGPPTVSPIADPIAEDPIAEDPMAQVTAVSQLRDVQPTDWAFQALQSLVERYGCIAGYPDKTYRGDRAMTRYEFAAGLNACMDRVNELIASATSDRVKPADLVSLQQIQEEFTAELATLRGRVDALEAKTATIAQQQFSTTTRLYGQAVFALQGSNAIEVDLFPRDGIAERRGQAQPNLGYNLQLSLATSFRGNDLLLTGLQTGNIGSTAGLLATNMGRLGYESELNNDLVISDLSYRFALNRNLGVIVGTAGVNPENTFRGINPLEGYGEGAFSLFGQRNPLLSLGNTTGGFGFDWQIARRISWQAVYSTDLPAFAEDRDRGGLFGGRYTLGTQLTLVPVDSVDVGIHYLFSHSPDGILGFGVGDAQVLSPLVVDPIAFNTHAIGATIAWRISSQWTIGAWGGWTHSNPIELSGSVQTTNWMVFSAFPDLFGIGNLGGILLGQPPKITSSSLPDGFNFPNFSQDGEPGGQPDSALHLEMFYRAKLTPQISVTPGLLVVFNPNHNQANDTLVVGVLRTTFQF